MGSDDDTLHIRQIVGCARCGGGHERVEARRMAQPFAPPEAGGLVWTHWVPCPTNGDPILIMVEEDAVTDERNGAAAAWQQGYVGLHVAPVTCADSEVRRG